MPSCPRPSPDSCTGPAGDDERPTPRLSKVIDAEPCGDEVDPTCIAQPSRSSPTPLTSTTRLGAVAADPVVDVEAVRVHDRHRRLAPESVRVESRLRHRSTETSRSAITWSSGSSQPGMISKMRSTVPGAGGRERLEHLSRVDDAGGVVLRGERPVVVGETVGLLQLHFDEAAPEAPQPRVRIALVSLGARDALMTDVEAQPPRNVIGVAVGEQILDARHRRRLADRTRFSMSR